MRKLSRPMPTSPALDHGILNIGSLSGQESLHLWSKLDGRHSGGGILDVPREFRNFADFEKVPVYHVERQWVRVFD